MIPAGIIYGLKIFAVLAALSMIGYGVKWTYDKHLKAIEDAVNLARIETALFEQKLAREATEKVRAEQEAERQAMQAELDRARANADNLRRMLTIDHDLDRLLQRKPGLILPRVNNGTEEVLLELEELTR